MIDYIVTKGSTATRYCPAVSDLLGRAHWGVVSDVSVSIHTRNGSVTKVNIPMGYQTDGATIPSLLYFFLPVRGSNDLATLVHDYLCDYGVADVDGVATIMERPQTDALFKDILIYLNMPKWKAKLIYWFVRAYAVVTRDVGPSRRTLKKRLIRLSEEIAKEEGE